MSDFGECRGTSLGFHACAWARVRSLLSFKCENIILEPRKAPQSLIKALGLESLYYYFIIIIIKKEEKCRGSFTSPPLPVTTLCFN